MVFACGVPTTLDYHGERVVVNCMREEGHDGEHLVLTMLECSEVRWEQEPERDPLSECPACGEAAIELTAMGDPDRTMTCMKRCGQKNWHVPHDAGTQFVKQMAAMHPPTGRSS